MSDKKIWFGTIYGTDRPGTSSDTSNSKMSWIPAPDTGMEASSAGYSEALEFENGGAAVVASSATHRNYGFDWNLSEASGAQGLDIVKNYQQKLYGPGLLYWSNPMIYDQNVLAPSMAAPGLIEQGWPNIYSAAPTFFGGGLVGAFEQPRRTATFVITEAVGVPPVGKNAIQVVAIPPTHVLWLGFNGTVGGGTAVVMVRPILANGNYATAVPLTLLGDASSTRMNTSFSGATYKAVEIYLARTSAVSSNIILRSGTAQLWPIGVTPTLTGNFIHGQGDTGLKFTSSAIPETYIMVDQSGAPRHYKGMSADLTEVGAWL